MRTDVPADRRAPLPYVLLAALLLIVTSFTLWHEVSLSAHAGNETCAICLTAHGATALASTAVTLLDLQPGLRIDSLAPSSLPTAASPQYQARAPPN